MAPFAFPHKADDGADEVMELQNTAHYHPNAASVHPISIFESINSVLHATKSTDANNNNGSQAGSSSGFLSTPPGQGEQEEETDVAILLALFVPLAATVTAIFIIALFVRKMRRSESHQEVQLRKNEFQMTPRQKTSSHSTVSVVSSSSSSSASSTTPSVQICHEQSRSGTPTSIQSNSIKGSNRNSLHVMGKSGISKSQQLDGIPSGMGGKSIYRNSSYFRLTPHLQLQYQASLPGQTVSSSPAGVNTPPWPIAPESGFYYTRSHYGLNKLHQQLYQRASLQAFSSVQSLNGMPVSRQYSDPQTYCSRTQSDPEIEMSSGDDEGSSSSKNKSSHKKLKRVLSAMNFPRRIRQYQADRKRFNIYTIPVETREQLKHIYVY